jgi:cyclopropane-fatty-acyl-phospholipid synthase
VLAPLVEKKLASLPSGVNVRVKLPDGTVIGNAQAPILLHAKSTRTLKNLANGDIGLLGDDYVQGRLEFEGSVRDLMAVATALLPSSPVTAARQSNLVAMISRLISVWRHSVERDAKHIEFHYDLSDDFYALWLDPHRAYSCAYYREPNLTLKAAQEAKFDHICTKLRLNAGERFLDIGAGWGGLLVWATEHYGVDATGITLSRNQHAYVSQLIEDKGLSHRCRIKLVDYRHLGSAEPFDKIASVGMFEHVGRANLTLYFDHVRQLLKPGGLILNHGITAGGVDNPQLGHGMGDFIEKYIFPGGELVHIGHVMTHMAQGGLEALDVENLRPHYARTLWAWSDALEARLDEAKSILNNEVGQRALRAYRLYLAGCAVGFEHGWMSLYQIVGQHNPQSGRPDELDYPTALAYPWRRDYMYKN